MFRVIMVFKCVQIVDEILKSFYKPALSGCAPPSNARWRLLFAGCRWALLSALLSAGLCAKIIYRDERLQHNLRVSFSPFPSFESSMCRNASARQRTVNAVGKA